MRVLVTGGSGFVGSHAVAALLGAGHEVRLLARRPERVPRALAPHAVRVDDVVTGDVMDEATVRSAMAGCDAILHGANMFELNPRRFEQMRRVNEGGTDLVLGSAVDAGLDPIIHISSFAALLPARGGYSLDAPVGDPKPAYSRTKALAERIARNYQNGGAPVVTVYPGLVVGPHDPHLGESATLTIHALKGYFGLLPKGLVPISDVRDVAAAIVALMEPDQGPRREFVVGHEIEFKELIEGLGHLTGRKLRVITVPGAMALASGRMADGLARVTGPLPLNYEAPWMVVNGGPLDTGNLSSLLGRPATPLEVTTGDTIRWLHEDGHISEKLAGDLAA
jgi:dihydroflavonol-4-reductase